MTPNINLQPDNYQKCMTEVSATSLTVLFTVKEVAEMLKTNENYVHKLRKARLLPFIKLGQYKVRKESLKLFLEQYEGKDVTDPFNVKEII